MFCFVCNTTQACKMVPSEHCVKGGGGLESYQLLTEEIDRMRPCSAVIATAVERMRG